MRSFFCLLSALCFLASSLHGNELVTDCIHHPGNPANQIEILSMAPEGKECFPLLLLLHGSSMQKGAQDFTQQQLQFWSERGVAVAAVSLPGYGLSGGDRDFCGQFTMQALHSAIDALKENLPITSVGVVGFGIGGMASVLLAGQRMDLCCAVSANGGYDLERLNNEEDQLRKIIVRSGQSISFNDDEISLRSPLQAASSIKTPLFLLHRKLNPLVTVEEVIRFEDKVNQSGGNCTAVLLEGGKINQKITYWEVVKEAGDWILRNLFYTKVPGGP